MSKRAFVFPGQGSQTVGMLDALIAADPVSQETLKKADKIVGFPLSQLIAEGPEDDLRRTDRAQPALFVTSALLYDRLKRRANALGHEEKARADFLAGHSLGEYSAYYASGALTFESALRIVTRRGALMHIAGEKKGGGMRAVLGGALPEIERVLATLPAILPAEEVVVAANLNAPGQVVISGTEKGLDAAEAALKKADIGVRRLIPLKVSGAFHSPLMAEAQAPLLEALRQEPWDTLTMPVVSNVTAEPVEQVADAQSLLVKQLVEPVRWIDTIQHMVRWGVDTFVEIGPGSVLKGLIQKIAPDVTVYTLSTPDDIEAYVRSSNG